MARERHWGKGWTGGDEDMRPRMSVPDALDKRRREQEFHQPTRGAKAALAVNKVVRQPGISAAQRRAKRAKHLNKRAQAQRDGTAKTPALSCLLYVMLVIAAIVMLIL